MIAITPLAEVTLPHRAYHIGRSESGHVVALSRQGAGSLISPDHQSIIPLDVAFEPRNVSVAADGSLLAVTARNGIKIISTPTLKPIHRLNDSFECSYFGSNGLLWTCARLYSDTVVLEIWDPQTWTVVAKTKITDPYGDSHIDLLAHPNENCVTVWAAAGQDGQCLFWARYSNGAITADRVPELDYTTWPSFSPTGKEFLVISEGELLRYNCPRGPVDARMQWPRDEEEDQIGDYVSYVDAYSALVQSGNGRLWLVDLETMTIDEELCIQGHEPKPLIEMYPSLRGERGLGSNLSFFLPLPDQRFISVHREISSNHPDDGHDRLVTWRVPEFE